MSCDEQATFSPASETAALVGVAGALGAIGADAVHRQGIRLNL
jgi:hypothetical protein